VPADDPASLCARLVRLMADSSLGSRLGDAARSEAHSRYSFDRMVAELDRLYANELARRWRAAGGTAPTGSLLTCAESQAPSISRRRSRSILSGSRR